MSEKKMKVPKRRFKEFKDANAWEQCKVKDICSISTGKSNTQDRIDDGDYPFYVRSPIIERSNKYLYDEEAVLTVGDGVGTGKVFHYVNGKYDLHQRVYRMFGFNNGVSGKYFNYYFSKYFYDRVMSMTAKTSVDSVRYEMISEMAIKYPLEQEQNQIVSTFENLDNLIILQQRKLAKMKALKKAYLTEMFPAEGERKPKLIFAGFTGDWEQCKLRDGTSKIGDGLHGTPVFKDNGDVYFINGNNLVNGKIEITDETKLVSYIEQSDNDKSLDDNTILMSINGTIGNLAWYSGEKIMLGKSAAFIKVRDFNKKYIYYFLQTSTIQEYFLNNLTGTTIKNLGLKTIREAIIDFPCIAEQIKIGQFFEELDNLITLQQNKLEKLHNIKKAYLNELFI